MNLEQMKANEADRQLESQEPVATLIVPRVHSYKITPRDKCYICKSVHHPTSVSSEKPPLIQYGFQNKDPQ